MRPLSAISAASAGATADIDTISLEELNAPEQEFGSRPTSKRYSGVDFASITTPARPLSVLHEAAFIFLILCAQLMTTGGIGIGIATLHVVGDHYNVENPGKRSWYVAAFSLTVGTFILIAGRLGDMYGHKRIFVAAFAWYGLWSIMCGAAYYSNDIFFSIARAIQGLGPAFLAPNALAIVGKTYPDGMKKNLIFAFFGACAPAGYVIHAAFASLLAMRLTWAWAFWIMGIACFMLAAEGFLIIPGDEQKISGEKEQGREKQSFDYLGSITGVCGLVLLNFAWNQGPVVGWGTPYVYVLLIISILSLAAFVVVEGRVAQPLLPVKVLTAPVLFILSATAVGWASFGIWLYYLWEFLQTLRHHSPLVASAQNVPAAITGFVASPVTGLLISNIPVPYIMIFALIAFCITPTLSSTMPINQIYWSQTFVSNLIIPFGMDMSFPAATIILSSSVPKEHQGISASLVLTVCNYSISLGLGIAGTVAVNIDKGSDDLLKQYRSAFYTAIGLAVFGLSIAVASAVYYWRHPLPKEQH